MHEPIESLPTGLNTKRPSPRRALLDLAPLELDCMNTLWPMGEGTVREIRDRLAERLPRAYTTIMTIMDRLARKGIVERRKVNRAYIYSPNLTAEQARTQALAQVLSNFFGGSKEALLMHLSAVSHTRAAAAVAGASIAYGGTGYLGGAAVPKASELSNEGASPLPPDAALSRLK